MIASRKTARIAGLLWLLMVPMGVFSLIYVPGKLIVRGNASETAGNILAHEWLFRIDIVVSLVSIVTWMFLALVLYRLFKDVNQQLAALVVILVLVQLPQSFVSQLLQLAALELVRGADFLSVIAKPHRETLAMFCLHVNTLGIHLLEVFWGLWLFPVGLLVYRSRFLPRTIGIWLIINCFAYIVISLTSLLFPEHARTVTNIAYPALFGELAIALWLFFVGVRPKPLPDLAQAPAGG